MEILISCDKVKGITITGDHTLLISTNLSVNITLNTALNPDWKKLSVSLTIKLSPCHPGFWQYPTSTNVNVTILMTFCFVLGVVQLLREIISLVM